MKGNGFGFGMPVTYRQTARGGYGYAFEVPAVVLGTTPKRVRIRVLTGGGRRDIQVKRERLEQREVDDMRAELERFALQPR